MREEPVIVREKREQNKKVEGSADALKSAIDEAYPDWLKKIKKKMLTELATISIWTA